MEVIAKAKFVRISPKKARPIADLLRGKNAREALVMLNAMPQKGAKLIGKVLASAMANAENNHSLEKEKLVVKGITVDGGPVLKRYMPRAQGRASEIRKRTSHIEVIVTGDVKTKKPKKEAEAAKIDAKEIKEDKKTDNKPEVSVNERLNTKDNISKAPKVFRRKTG